MKFNKMDIKSHFEFRIRVVNEDYDMIICKPNGTYFKGNRQDTFINNKNPEVVAERFDLNEKNGIKSVIIPMEAEETNLYLEYFNKVRGEKGWKPITFDFKDF